MRTSIVANENTDVDVAVNELRTRCNAAGVAALDVDLLADQLRGVLSPLVSNGRMLSAQGSQLKVERELKVGNTTVMVTFGAGVPQSYWKKFLMRLVGS